MEKLNQTDARSHDILADNIAKLKAIFPEAFTEGKVDFEVLKETLGEYRETREERYNFSWAGKSKARRLAQTPTTGTLRPCPEESVDWDNTENLFIEGDNLEVLKLLQKSYQGQVKMIYIDPPYNTGKDFVYPDKYADNLKGYLEYTGQTDEAGNKQSTNTETSGRYHTNWLNMITPRLMLAKNLLRADGAIFISIDDNEVTNASQLCNEIFGEENHIATLTVINNMKGRNDKANVATCHEYLLVYGKPDFVSNGLPLSEEKLAEFKHTDKNGEAYALRDLRKRGRPDRREDRPNMWFPIFYNQLSGECSLERVSDTDIEITPQRGDLSDGRWRWGRKRVETNLKFLHPRYSKKKERWDIDHRVYLNPSIVADDNEEETDDDDQNFERTSKPKSFWWGGDISTDVANREFKKLFDDIDPDYPKSPYFIEKLLRMGTTDGDIIVDFFAGYSTTAHATYLLNKDDSSKRKFVMVQLPEKFAPDREEYKAGYNTLAELSSDRIRRIASAIKEEKPDYDGDLGFKVFKLDSSNIEAWDSNIENLEDNVLKAANVLKDDRSELDIVYELFLKYGLDLSYPVNTHEVAGKQVYEIGAGSLFICLEDGITNEFVEALIKLYETFDSEAAPRVVFKDSGFKTDAAKKDAESTLKDRGILDVKCL